VRLAQLTSVALLWALAALPLPGTAKPPVTTIPVYGYQVVHSYPHDINAFTEGLFYKDGFLYESTGLEGGSSVRKVELTTGRPIQKADLPSNVFGEGIANWNDQLVGLTWRSRIGYVLNLQSLSLTRQFTYAGEGWGLTHNDRELIMSDGTAELRFIDPATLQETRRLSVTADGKPVDQLNELEWVDGEIYSNIWQTDRIARIDPATGHVVGWINLAKILPANERIANHTDVLNGIAYDAATKRLFVTGKFWPKLFEIRLVKGK
jgi:glutaminyl-peptide cyclotransferase